MAINTASQGKVDNVKPIVLYITGLGRSGSTIIDTILGQVDGVFSSGELRLAGDLTSIGGRICGCGEQISNCSVWSRILAASARGGNSGRLVTADSAANVGLEQGRLKSFGRITKYPNRLWHWPMLWWGYKGQAVGKVPAQRLGWIYRKIAEVTGARIIVDSSKSPTYCYILGQLGSVDLRVIHVVRDPRAVAYSWTKVKEQPAAAGVKYMRRYHPLITALRWVLWNKAIQRYWSIHPDKYRLVRYEDFVDQPESVSRQILELVNMEDADLPFTGNGEVVLKPTHTVWGNPHRLQTGPVSIRPDTAWENRLPKSARRGVTLITKPLLRKFGYLGASASTQVG